jgi:hypothetical protein
VGEEEVRPEHQADLPEIGMEVADEDVRVLDLLAADLHDRDRRDPELVQRAADAPRHAHRGHAGAVRRDADLLGRLQGQHGAR